MNRIDRLSSLLAHFQMSVVLAPAGTGNLSIIGDRIMREPRRIEFCSSGAVTRPEADEVILVEASANWGGATNPLVAALPRRIVLSVADDDETAALLRVVLAEARAMRCGADSVLSRLGEVLFVRLMRAQIEKGAVETGLLAGLADQRICRAIVAMHGTPGRVWRNDELASVAGLSVSRFADVFQTHMGQTPQSYLRRWRMTLARQDIARGDRIKAVSRRYGYASSEALTRAFQRQYGTSPMSVRRSKFNSNPQIRSVQSKALNQVSDRV
jgi:AraC-like DNA-binding protein